MPRRRPTGTFNEPWGVAVDSKGSVYVADTWNFRIQKFSADGDFLKAWGSYTNEGSGYQFYGPRAIAIDSRTGCLSPTPGTNASPSTTRKAVS